MTPAPRRSTHRHASTTRDGSEQHRSWLGLIEVSGPFLSLPVLRAEWPDLDALDRPTRDRLRREHASWQSDPAAGQAAWTRYVLRELLGWGDALLVGGLDVLAADVPEHDARITPFFALVEPGEEVKPDTTRLLGVVCAAGTRPDARIAGEAWAATPVDRLAHLCRHHDIELGLATDGRWWALVWAPRGGATTTAVFDAVAWPEAAERDVVRAFVSLLCRSRFFAVPADKTLVPLLRDSLGSQEDITVALGTQVRQAVELLVAALGRSGVGDVEAHEVYRGAVTVMMRTVFLLFAEERGLLPSDNDLYATTYSAGRLCSELEQRALEGSEDDLEHTYIAWHRLLALFEAVYHGVGHTRLTMHPHDGSLFDPADLPWLPLTVDDRTVLHVLRAVQHVRIGSGRTAERRTLSFRNMDVEQIGYVYEGLLSYDGFRATEVVVGLAGRSGVEEEVALRELESLAAQCPDVPALAARIAAEYKESGIGSPAALQKRLTPLAGTEEVEARRKLLAVVRGDYPLAERLLPFYGLIRHDLRDLPFVVLPGELYVTESPLRGNTGTHYTPRFLAEEVVENALEPLVYSPGPLQTADESRWRLQSSREIVALKVADIAMGSGAFLVAAARYLAARLIEAWVREGDALVGDYTVSPDSVADENDPVVIEARRQVIEHCLYGVDINPMAVEMAKLSLWLVSMDPRRPFTFLDDRLIAGDSLLGITSLDQLDYMHLDPVKGRQIHERSLHDFTAGVRVLVAEIAVARRAVTEIDGSTMDGVLRKRAALTDIEHKTRRARLYADLTVGAALANAGRGDRALRDASIQAADIARRDGGAEAGDQAARWLATDLLSGVFPRVPLHWPLVFPEVFLEHRGFDAIIGNPPYLGGTKITGVTGTFYREHVIERIANGVRASGRCDLVAYFVLRAHELLRESGQTGLVATNSLAESDTREVGLDQVVSRAEIRRCVKSQKWPSRSATLEICKVWTSLLALGEDAERVAEGFAVAGISPALEPMSRVTGTARRLRGQPTIAFEGSKLDGVGFVLSRVEAERLIRKQNRNGDVIAPYLGGKDVNSQPDLAATRSVINFRDWTEGQARSYPDCFDVVERLVRPQRATHSERNARGQWWRFQRSRPDLYAAIANHSHVIVITLVSRTAMPVMVPSGQVFAHSLGVFATQDRAILAMLSSAHHYWWAKARGSSMKADLRYTPSDVFETFPLPELTADLRELGERLDSFRRDVMLSRDLGLTKTYNLVFDRTCDDTDIAELRRIHREIDEATVRAYGWEDRIAAIGGLDHGFHKVGRENRYTVGPPAQRELLDSLLELNHERYAEEVAAGLHDNAKNKAAAEPKELF